jgi:hypothetical protein
MSESVLRMADELTELVRQQRSPSAPSDPASERSATTSTAALSGADMKELVKRAETVALRHRAAATAIVAEERAAWNLPAPPVGIPQHPEPGPAPPQPPRTPPKVGAPT